MPTPKQLDVYRDWLSIQEPNRPLDHYQLLRLKQFEDNTAKIREHYRKMNAHVRKYAGGEYAQQSQDLLNELAKAMLCLTDSVRKGEYDASLGRKGVAEGQRPTFEQILLSRKVIDQEKLEKARNFAHVVGVDVRDALLQQKLAKSDDVMPAYAESIGLPFIDLHDIAIDGELLRRVPPVVARQHSCVPIMLDGQRLLMASPNPIDPHVEEELRLRFGVPVRTVLCTPARVNEVITQHYGKDAPAAPAPAASATATANTSGAPAAPLTAQEREDWGKRRRSIAIITFNFSFMLAMFAQMMLTQSGFFVKLAIALAVAVVAAGIAWKVRR